jgi:zinc transporter ZupT
VKPLGQGSQILTADNALIESSLFYFVLGLLAGFLMTVWAPFAKLFKPHRHSSDCREAQTSCHHSIQSQKSLTTFWLLGLVPHSVADGIFWGLSLGFTPVFAREVFLFLIIHRSIELASWVGLLYARFKYRKRIIVFVLLSIGSFLAGALLTIQMGPGFWAYKDIVAKVLLLTLGYLVFLAISEVKLLLAEQFEKRNFHKKSLALLALLFCVGVTVAHLAFKIVKIFE